VPVSGERVTVTRTIAAPADRIWEVVAHPQGHVDIDGSGMLEAADDARPLVAVGDTFDIKMDRTPLNDIPGLVKYEVRNTVTRLEPGSLIEWGIGGKDTPPLGHVYAWSLTPSADGASTDVTHYCDWTGAPAQLKEAREWPIVPESMLEQSLDKLESLVTDR
jgi:uncharacterized protein YndB with AHSA1/START domain